MNRLSLFVPVLLAVSATLALAIRARGADSADPDGEARALVLRFVSERLHGDFDAFIDFDLAALEGDEVFGNGGGRSFDPDDCNITRAVFELVWGDTLPDLRGNIGTGRKWRGDTLNTFHTAFGKPTDGPFRYRGLQYRAPDTAFLDRADAFHSLYHSIGNFAPLPNLPVNGKTLNMYRADPWKDYFDRFLIALRAELNGEGTDAGLSALVAKNDWFFASRRGPEGFSSIVRDLLLTDYLDASGVPVERFPFLFWWDRSQSDPAVYLADGDRYMAEASRIIRARGRRIVEILRSKCATGQ